MTFRAPIVYVTWGDAWIDTEDFCEKVASKTKNCVRTTVGFLVAETEDGVCLATDEYAKTKEGYAARMHIPWGMILEWGDLTAE